MAALSIWSGLWTQEQEKTCSLSSFGAFCNQGVPAEWVESYSTVSSSPLTFETDGGAKVHVVFRDEVSSVWWLRFWLRNRWEKIKKAMGCQNHQWSNWQRTWIQEVSPWEGFSRSTWRSFDQEVRFLQHEHGNLFCVNIVSTWDLGQNPCTSSVTVSPWPP